MSCARPPSCLTTNLVRSLSHVRPGENTRSEETRGHRAFASSAGLLPQKHTPPSQATATERKASGATQLTHFPSPPVKKAPLRFQSLLRPITPSKVKNYCPISLAPPATPAYRTVHLQPPALRSPSRLSINTQYPPASLPPPLPSLHSLLALAIGSIDAAAAAMAPFATPMRSASLQLSALLCVLLCSGNAWTNAHRANSVGRTSERG